MPPNADDTLVIKPSQGKIIQTLALMVGVTCLGMWMITTRLPVLVVSGLVLGGLCGVASVMGFMKALNNGYDLCLTPEGFDVGHKHYSWGDAGPGFRVAYVGRNNVKQVRFGVSGFRGFANVYDMSPDTLAALMNERLAVATGITTALPTTQPDWPQRPRDLPGAEAAPRRTLSAKVWITILLAAFSLFMLRGVIIDALWQNFGPVSYAAHFYDDQTLADHAGFNPALLPVMRARIAQGDKSAMYFYGNLFNPTDFTCETAVPKNPATAVYWFEQAVALDDEGAERDLGILYLQGIGVPQDDGMAAEMLEKSVTHNDDIGSYQLGVMLEQGQGEPQDLPRAFRLEQAAAAQNERDGEVELGKMYAQGIGTTPDMTQAAQYWREAAGQGSNAARALLQQYNLPLD